MASILPPSIEGAKELAKLWSAGQLNQLPRALTIRIVALRIIELIATRQIPVPDQSSCLLGAARVYYKLTVHLKKDAQYLNDSMLSIDFVQRRIDQHNAKIQQQANNKLSAATASTIKKGLINPIKKHRQRPIPSVSPSPSTTSTVGGSTNPEFSHSMVEQSLDFDPQDSLSGLQDNLHNYDFDFMNQDHRAELLGALDDIEKRGEAELGYLYNMSVDLQGQPGLPAPANLFNQSTADSDFLYQFDGTSQLQALDDQAAYGLDLSGVDQYNMSGLNNSLLSRSIGSNAVVVRDQHGNPVNQSRLSISSPLDQRKFQGQMDLDFGDQAPRNYSDFGGLDFDDFSSSQGDIGLDPSTGLPVTAHDKQHSFQQQQQQQQQEQQQQHQQQLFHTSASSVNPSAFAGINEFLFNVVVRDQPRGGVLQQEDEVLIEAQKPQRKIRKQNQDQIAAAKRNNRQHDQDDVPAVKRRSVKILASAAAAKKHKEARPQTRSVNQNDIDTQISLQAPEFDQDSSAPDIHSDHNQTQHDLYGFDNNMLLSDGLLSDEMRRDHLLSSESSTVLVRDFHPDQAGGRLGPGRVAKFAHNNSFANPAALNSPFKSPQVPTAIKFPQSNFTLEDFDLPSDPSSSQGSVFHQQQQQQQQQLQSRHTEEQLTLAQSLHQQEEFNFSFLSANSLAFSRTAAENSNHNAHALHFIDESTTTTQASVTELFYIVSEAHPRLVPSIVRAQKIKASHKETTIPLSAPSQHKLQLLASLQPVLTQDLSQSLPVTTLTAIDQTNNNYDGFRNFGGLEDQENGDFDTFAQAPSLNLTRISKHSRHSLKSTLTTPALRHSHQPGLNNRHNNLSLSFSPSPSLRREPEDEFGEDFEYDLQESIRDEIDSILLQPQFHSNLTLSSLSNTFQTHFCSVPNNQQTLQSLVKDSIADEDTMMLASNSTAPFSSLCAASAAQQLHRQHLIAAQSPAIKPIIVNKPLKKNAAVLSANPMNQFLPQTDIPALEDFDDAFPDNTIVIPVPQTISSPRDEQLHLQLHQAPVANPDHLPPLSSISQQFHPTLQRQQQALIENDFTFNSRLPSILHELPFPTSSLNQSIVSDLHIQDQILYNLLQTQSTQLHFNTLALQVVTNHHQQQQRIRHQLPAPILPPELPPAALDDSTVNHADQFALVQALQAARLKDSGVAREIVLKNRKALNSDFWYQQRTVLLSKQLEMPAASLSSRDTATVDQKQSDEGIPPNYDAFEMDSSLDLQLNSDDVFNDDTYNQSMFSGGTFAMTGQRPQQTNNFHTFGHEHDLDNLGQTHDPDQTETQRAIFHYDGDVNVDFTLDWTSQSSDHDAFGLTQTEGGSKLDYSLLGGKVVEQNDKIVDFSRINQLDESILGNLSHQQHQHQHQYQYHNQCDLGGLEDDETGDLNLKQQHQTQHAFDDFSDEIFGSDDDFLILSETAHGALNRWASQQDDLRSESDATQQDHRNPTIQSRTYVDILKSLGVDSKHLFHLILDLLNAKKQPHSQTRDTQTINSDDTIQAQSSLSVTLSQLIEARFQFVLSFYQQHNKNTSKITRRHIASSTFFLILHLVKHGLIDAKQSTAYNTISISLKELETGR